MPSRGMSRTIGFFLSGVVTAFRGDSLFALLALAGASLADTRGEFSRFEALLGLGGSFLMILGPTSSEAVLPYSNAAACKAAAGLLFA